MRFAGSRVVCPRWKERPACLTNEYLQHGSSSGIKRFNPGSVGWPLGEVAFPFAFPRYFHYSAGAPRVGFKKIIAKIFIKIENPCEKSKGYRALKIFKIHRPTFFAGFDFSLRKHWFHSVFADPVQGSFKNYSLGPPSGIMVPEASCIFRKFSTKFSKDRGPRGDLKFFENF